MWTVSDMLTLYKLFVMFSGPVRREYVDTDVNINGMYNLDKKMIRMYSRTDYGVLFAFEYSVLRMIMISVVVHFSSAHHMHVVRSRHSYSFKKMIRPTIQDDANSPL